MLALISRWLQRIDYFTELSGRLISWLILLLVLLTSYDVFMRYVFSQGSVALQELEWHIFALIFLLGGAYTLKHDGHVRVDVLFNSRWLTNRHRAWINIFGTLILLMPFCVLIIISTWPFVQNAFWYQEGSPDPGGLPYRFLIKSSIVVGFSLLLIQSIGELFRNILVLKQTGGQ
ncbi:TRAP-type mannitol/chloroaromatic compound transport system, small permease component [Methylophaga frappieri]|uniref:TRAP transporter small permease protein n=1 Tax=Methylophaga frappieri (strain ATCC BAA-2434 / DSM 25690 / JAM7) TaxID=754477 RepID=I1YHB9_METFJ|nr:TRAP transporter small permease subunit [Methylophaga frappieri]AFJ02312.1 TRAP-type mannitol/chloroaromatic compound transport system, small permease component [Methylophaga frappieri]